MLLWLAATAFGAESHCFESGLRVAIARDATRPRVGIAAVVGSGQSDEEQSQRGVAHLTEHLWGRATPGGGAPVDVRLRDLGIEWSAWTTPDDTRFVVAGPARLLGRLRAVTPQRLADTFAGCAGHEVITVLGDPALVTSELAGVGLEVAP